MNIPVSNTKYFLVVGLFLLAELLNANEVAGHLKLNISSVYPFYENFKPESVPAVITSALGEIEPHRLHIVSNQNINDVEVIVSDFRSEESLLEAKNIEIRIVKEWFQAGTAGEFIHTGKGRKLISELLLRDDRLVKVDYKNQKNYVRIFKGGNYKFVDTEKVYINSKHQYRKVGIFEFPVYDAKEFKWFSLRANSSRDLWLNFLTPSTKKPGKYKGKIEFKDKINNQIVGSYELTWHILPIKLKASSKINSIYYRGQLADGGTISSEFKNEYQLRAELINLVDHGINYPSIYQPFHTDKEGRKLERYLRLRSQLGITNKFILYLGITLGHPKLYPTLDKVNEAMKILKPIFKKHGVETLYLYAAEELSPEKLVEISELLKEGQSQGYNLFTTGYRGTWDVIGENLQLYVAKEIDKNTIRKVKSKGKKILIHKPQGGIENSEMYRKSYGIDIWVSDMDGIIPYAYQGDFDFSWNDFDHYKYRDHALTYPTVNGVIDTISWEAIREAIDDQRYLDFLEELVNKYFDRNECLINAKLFLSNLSESVKDLSPAQIREQAISQILYVIENC